MVYIGVKIQMQTRKDLTIRIYIKDFSIWKCLLAYGTSIAGLVGKMRIGL